jgi:hypothetical protein
MIAVEDVSFQSEINAPRRGSPAILVAGELMRHPASTQAKLLER